MLAGRGRSAEGVQWWLTLVRDVMRRVQVTASPTIRPWSRWSASLRPPDALVPVIENGFLVGIVTATDLLDDELRSWATSPAAITAADVVTEAPITVGRTVPPIDAPPTRRTVDSRRHS